MGALHQRLNWSEDGALHDGPRRYLMMRTDVLMGTLLRLPPAAQADWLLAWAASTKEHGAASLQAYAAMPGGGVAALADSTVQAAADLGWGRWDLQPLGDGLQLQVHGSPFVQGWRAAQAASPPGQATVLSKPLHQPLQLPICAPISGMFAALASLLLKSPVQVTETTCAALLDSNHDVCTFVARRLQP